MPGGDMFGGMDMDLMWKAMQILLDAGGELTDDAKAALLDLGLTEEQIDMFANMRNRMPGGNGGQGGFPDRGGQNVLPGGIDAGGGQGNPPQGGNMPGGNGMGNPPGPGPGPGPGTGTGTASQSGMNAEYIIMIAALLFLLTGATVFIAKPKKNAI